MSEAEADPAVRLNRMTLMFVLAVVLLNTLSLGIVSPVLPILVKQLANGNTIQAAEAVRLPARGDRHAKRYRIYSEPVRQHRFVELDPSRTAMCGGPG